MTTITKEQAQEIIDAADEVITALAGTNEDVHPDNSQEMIRLYDDLNDHYAPPEVVRELARIALVSLDAEPVSQPYKLPEEKGASLQLRNLIRKRHAEWSDSTFGNVGPVGPLKHLSKEALEAAAEPGDLSEWADMQFLLWDAQRRAGISDGEITAAMEEKLKVNMARQWPEPKDGEPRLHIKEQPAPVVPDDWVMVPKEPTQAMINAWLSEVADWRGHVAGYKAALAAAPKPQNVPQNIPENIPSGKSTLTPDGWISCSERMPAQDDWVLIYSKHGEYLAGQVQGEYVELNDGTLSWLGSALHWMPLPEPPQEVNRG
ncbi:dATP/dGTP pyrophosphohydrolase domain-containing protein [Salmonella enterica]